MFLSGAKIKGGGSHIIEIEGVEQLHGADHTVIPDRIEAGTFMAAAAITGGDLEIKGARAEHLHAVRDKLEEAGVTVTRNNGTIRVTSNGDLKPVDVITMPYPGFDTTTSHAASRSVYDRSARRSMSADTTRTRDGGVADLLAS